MKIGARIKSRRQELSLSQEELARKIGYTSRTSIAKIEAGDIDLPQSKIVAFAEALETTPSWIMGLGNDQPKPFDPAEDEEINAMLADPEYRALFKKTAKMSKQDLEFVKRLIESIKVD